MSKLSSFKPGHLFVKAENTERGRGFIERLKAFTVNNGGKVLQPTHFSLPEGTDAQIIFVDFAHHVGYTDLSREEGSALYRQQMSFRNKLLDFLREEAYTVGTLKRPRFRLLQRIFDMFREP